MQRPMLVRIKIRSALFGVQREAEERRWVFERIDHLHYKCAILSGTLSNVVCYEKINMSFSVRQLFPPHKLPVWLRRLVAGRMNIPLTGCCHTATKSGYKSPTAVTPLYLFTRSHSYSHEWRYPSKQRRFLNAIISNKRPAFQWWVLREERKTNKGKRK